MYIHTYISHYHHSTHLTHHSTSTLYLSVYLHFTKYIASNLFQKPSRTHEQTIETRTPGVGFCSLVSPRATGAALQFRRRLTADAGAGSAPSGGPDGDIGGRWAVGGGRRAVGGGRRISLMPGPVGCGPPRRRPGAARRSSPTQLGPRSIERSPPPPPRRSGCGPRGCIIFASIGIEDVLGSRR